MICFCLLGIVSALPVKTTDSGSSEEKQTTVSTEDTYDVIQETLPSKSIESEDHTNDLDDDDDDDHVNSQDSMDSDDSDEDDDDDNNSDHSDESEETTTDTSTDIPATLVFTLATPTADTNDGRGDSLAYGLRLKSKKLLSSETQYSDATEDLTSHMESDEDTQDSAPSLQMTSDGDSHQESVKSQVSHESHSQEWHSQEGQADAPPPSVEDTHLKFRVSHEMESTSSEAN